jgi:hypothetical protein
VPATTSARTFHLRPNGDPYSGRWSTVIHETDDSGGRTYRGDLGPYPNPRRAADHLRRLYPGCRIRWNRRDY